VLIKDFSARRGQATLQLASVQPKHGGAERYTSRLAYLIDEKQLTKDSQPAQMVITAILQFDYAALAH